jgi:RNA:NAD 2'-phosphotransferase (TPT1/KptA family)
MSNDNHDPANGQFSSGGGGQPRQHPDAAANAHDVHADIKASAPGGKNFDTVTMYHGGAKEILASVEKNGLRVGKDKNAWLASNKSTATMFAEGGGRQGVVFEVNVPKAELATFRSMTFGKNTTTGVPHAIPPDWISGYRAVDPKTGKLGALNRMKKK